jgi:hypothetical protein
MITTPFHAGVRFERVSRYSIKLEVDTEPFNNFVEDLRAYARRGSVPEHRSGCSDEWPDPRLQGLIKSPCNAASSSLHGHSSPWIPSYTSTPLSKTGRSTSPVSRPFRKDCYLSANDAVEGENMDIDQAARQTLHHQALHAFTTNQSTVNPECSSASSEKMNSPGKRKDWSSSGLCIDAAEAPTLNKGDRPNLEVDTKRRKLQQNVDTDVVMRPDSDFYS